jgi:MFS family permease
MLALLWFLYMSFGMIVTSMASLVTPILKDLNMSYSQMGFILGSWQLTYILSSIGAGQIIDKWGTHKSLFAGTLLIALSAGLRFLPNGFGTLLPIVALFGLGGPMISIGGPKTISLWFKGKSRATGLTIFMTGSSTGMLLGLTLTNSIVMPLAGGGWRITFLGYGILVLMIGLLWWFFARELKPETSAENLGFVNVFKKIIRIRNVQLILAIGLLVMATLHGFSNWFPKILQAQGVSPTMAGFTAGVPVTAGIIGVLTLARIIPSHLRGRALAVYAVCVATALSIVSLVSGISQLFILVLYGMAASSFLPILVLILLDGCGIESGYLGSAGGTFFCIAEIGLRAC